MHKTIHYMAGLVVSLATLLAAGPVKAQQDQDPDGTLRFHMTQNGRQMTANDFDAWMAKKGLRVARGQAVWNQPSGLAHSNPPPAFMDGGANGGLSVILPERERATAPIQTAPAAPKAQYDSDGRLLGFDSGWSDSGASRAVAPTANYQSGSSNAPITAYDSGRDY